MKRKILTFLRFFSIAIFVFTALAPLYWIFVTSVKGSTETYSFPVSYWPKEFTWDNYIFLFKSMNFGQFLTNSLFVSLGGATIALLLASLSGYVISRKRFRFKSLVIFIMFLTQMIPGFIIMTPLYTMFGSVRIGSASLVNSLSVLILIYTSMMIPFSVIMMKGFFDRIPDSLEEAARIDGCSNIGALFRVIIPVTLPGLAATFSFAFVNCWNELFLAIMFINSESKKTIPVGLNTFIGKADIDWGAMSAGSIMALIPTIFIFAFAQKYIVQGLTQGAVKE